MERSPLEALRAATAVFDGTIVDQRAGLTEVHGSTTAAIVYEVAVRRLWRRRRKPGALLLAGALVTAAFAVVWSGHRLLQNEWFSAFLSW